MKVAVYARVSTLNHGQDPQVQLSVFRKSGHITPWPEREGITAMLDAMGIEDYRDPESFERRIGLVDEIQRVLLVFGSKRRLTLRMKARHL